MEETILSHIRSEHGMIQEALKLTADASHDLKNELYTVAKELLVKHMQSEEHSFFRKISADDKRAESLVLELQNDHQKVKEMLQKLNLMDASSEEWQILFQELRSNVEAHCRKEEGELFAEAKEDYSREELEGMVADFEAAKSQSESATFYE